MKKVVDIMRESCHNIHSIIETEMENMTLETILIENINTFRGSRPAGFDLVEYEKGTDPMDGFVLYGFDEIGMMVPPSKAAHAFVSTGL